MSRRWDGAEHRDLASGGCTNTTSWPSRTGAGRGFRRSPPRPDLVVETADGRFCGAVVAVERAVDAGEKRDVVTLEDRHGKRRTFAMLPAAFLLDGTPGDARPSRRCTAAPKRRTKTASGSYAVAGAPARVARASRIWVEGVHDAALLERIWGDDLRVEGIVVEPLDGIDHLADALREFGPGPTAPGRRARRPPRRGQQGDPPRRRRPRPERAGHRPPVRRRVAGGQAVRPRHRRVAGRAARDGLEDRRLRCAAACANPRELWRRVLASVDSYADVEVPLLRAVEELIDFVTGLSRCVRGATMGACPPG